MLNKAIAYVKSSFEEMKKVTWPTAKQTRDYTLLVIGISVATALFLGGLDYLFSWILQTIIDSR